MKSLRQLIEYFTGQAPVVITVLLASEHHGLLQEVSLLTPLHTKLSRATVSLQKKEIFGSENENVLRGTAKE